MMFEDIIRLVVERITEKYNPKAIIIFGSVAKGSSNEDSDLDIAVIMDSQLSEHDRNVAIRTCIGPIGMAVDVLVFTPEEVKSQDCDNQSIIYDILKDGKIVYGSI